MSKTKIGTFIVKDVCYNCQTDIYCPYYEFTYDDNDYDSGSFCRHPDVGNKDKIADENAQLNFDRDMYRWKYNKKKNTEGLFPLLDETEPIDPFLIPDWCPLPDKTL